MPASRFPTVACLLVLLPACDAADPPTGELLAPDVATFSVEFGEWSVPVNLGPPINTPSVTDGNPVLSGDGLALFYDSDRTDLPGAQGARDIWVSRRACTESADPACAWQTPVNLGPRINTPYVDASPDLSDDGHYLFFVSHTTRPDCPADPAAPDPTRPCDEDVYVAWRADPNDDTGWSAAVRVPSPVSSIDGEGEPEFVRSAGPDGNLYFSRRVGGANPGFDIFRATVLLMPGVDGPQVVVSGDVVALDEVNLANVFDGGPSVSANGRELLFHSALQRPGLGAVDIWASTRHGPLDPWSTPANVTALNSTMVELSPAVSRDGRTIVFTSNRQGPGGPAGWDIYMARRERREY